MTAARDIDATAAAFLARRDGHHWTEKDAQALRSWIEESTQHRVSYLRLSASWEQLDRLAALQVPAASAPNITRSNRRAPIRKIAAMAAALLLVVSTAVGIQHVDTGANTFTTSVGGRQSIPLSDGTKVELNTNSKLVAAVNKTARRVWLEHGEAYFDVAHDAQNPFTVEAGSRRIVVLGTKFVVRREGTQVTVRVLDGRVRVESSRAANDGSAKPTIALRGDQVLTEGTKAAVLVKRNNLGEVENALAWRDGLLIFDGTTLGQAAGEFNRYSGRRLVVSGEAASEQIEGTFAAGDVDAFVRILHDAYGFRVRRERDQIIIS